MGWLGWTPEVALDTPMPLIALALKGRREAWRSLIEALPAAFGLPAPKRAQAPREIDRAAVAKKTASLFRAMARKHKRESGN